MFKLQLWLFDKKLHFIKIIVKGMYLARNCKMGKWDSTDIFKLH